jgi:GT2 family glycosyltransferase
MTGGISVVIPNYNGGSYLLKCIQSAVEAVEFASVEYEIIVVDNISEDGSGEAAKRNFPFIKVLSFRDAQGFGPTSNYGFERANYGLVLLLNNDVFLDKWFVLKALPYFQENSVFAVTGLILGSENGVDFQRNGVYFKLGRYKVRLLSQEMGVTFFASGAASLIDRMKFFKLGGFDDIFAPFYKEDIDLSFRAWRMGWKVVFEPACRGYHIGSAVISKLPREKVEIIKWRNEWLFQWKNLCSTKLLVSHILWLFPHLISSSFKNPLSLTGFIAALKKSKEVYFKRKGLPRKVSDSEILNLFTERVNSR